MSYLPVELGITGTGTRISEYVLLAGRSQKLAKSHKLLGQNNTFLHPKRECSMEEENLSSDEIQISRKVNNAETDNLDY